MGSLLIFCITHIGRIWIGLSMFIVHVDSFLPWLELVKERREATGQPDGGEEVDRESRERDPDGPCDGPNGRLG